MTKYSEDKIERAAEMREAGHTIAHIARTLEMSRGAVDWHCLRRGADVPEPRKVTNFGPPVVNRSGHVVRRFSPEDDAKILDLEREGVSVCEIARRIGRRHNSVIGRLATLARRDARREVDHV